MFVPSSQGSRNWCVVRIIFTVYVIMGPRGSVIAESAETCSHLVISHSLGRCINVQMLSRMFPTATGT